MVDEQGSAAGARSSPSSPSSSPSSPASAGPAVVAVGGGHGLSATLRAARRYAGSVTAVVSVADDGGSTGRLRAQFPDLPAPGDVRRCIGAVAADEDAFAEILEHRFAGGELDGHALGNLLLVALAAELGSFEAAVDELSRRVGAVGRVLPATVEPVELVGHVCGDDGTVTATEVVGQVVVHNTPGLVGLTLRPEQPESPPAVREVIQGADQVVLGPGSLFTSVLAAAVVPAVREALASSAAQKVLVANLRPQQPETAGLSAADEVALLAEHGIDVDVVVVDHRRGSDGAERTGERLCWEVCDVADDRGLVHDPVRLATVLARLAGPGHLEP